MIVKESELIVSRVSHSRIHAVDFEKLPFGKVFSDHMIEMNFERGKWQTPELKPYGNLELSPATSALHYGQAIFEGMKAYRNQKNTNEILLFRPQDNAARFAKSALRMGLPQVPIQLFMELLTELIRTDRAWVPTALDGSLYIRPVLFATDPYVGVQPSESSKFLIFTCPVGPYYNKSLNVLISDTYVRAFKGGTGNVKAAGNYAATMYPFMLAKAQGFDQILWTDGFTHEYVEECGTMNVAFIIDNKVVTPALSGSILDGITRNSTLQLFKEIGIEVEERKVAVKELFEAYAKGTLTDAFGIGTAAGIKPIDSFTFEGNKIQMPPTNQRPLSEKVHKMLDEVRRGIQPDRYNWVVKV